MDARHAQVVSIPEPIFQFYRILKDNFRARPSWQSMTEEEVWSELCLCILSSNVPYELARSCMIHLRETGMLDDEWILSKRNSRTIIAHELSRPIYSPKRKDGNYRKYRFPKVRAQNIVDAAKAIYSNHEGIKHMLYNSNSHQELRNMMAQRIPGLGLKESSHFLRNIGYSSELAIIDVHIISFLRYVGLVSDAKITLSPKVYFELENLMQQISREYGFNLAILDNAIWHYMRSRCDA